jgi:MFS transporter, DHA1 family, solute carrier family 18 (vesicular amine transporter), member 1/2
MTRQPRVVYWVVFLDALLMFAIVPLLPGYVRDLHLTKTEAGLIVGVYSGAVLVGSVPVGYLAARVGARRLTIFGVALLAVATFGCGFAGGFWPLMAARIGQGLSSAVSWTAGMAWLSEGTPPQSRGRVLGTAMSFATIGTLIGPVAGGLLGGAYGPRTPFTLLGCVAIVLTVAVARAPAGAPDVRPVAFRSLLRAVGASRGVLTALVMMLLVATVSGTLETLVPLRLGSDGYSAVAITIVLTAAGLVASVATYATGRVFDRLGGIPIAIMSIVAMAAFVAALAVARTGLQLAVVFVASTLPITGQYAVAFPLCAEGADQAGLAHANVFGLLNLAWGAGFLVGPAAGAALAQSTSDRLTYLTLVVLSLAVAAVLRLLALSHKECQPSRLNAG